MAKVSSTLKTGVKASTEVKAVPRRIGQNVPIPKLDLDAEPVVEVEKLVPGDGKTYDGEVREEGVLYKVKMKVKKPSVTVLIERRLSLTGGTTPKEAGAEIARIHMPKEMNTKEKRNEVIEGCSRLFLKYLNDNYGDDIRDSFGRLIGIGDRIRIDDRGHYSKLY